MTIHDKDKISIIPLGGVGERGKNMLLVETKDDIVAIDCGFMIPGEEHLGIDLVIPDLTYLLENESKFRGIVLTHGHDGHVGALPYILRQLRVPVIGSPMTIGIAREILHEAGIKQYDLRPMAFDDRILLGKVEIELISVNHTLPGSAAVVLDTPCGKVVHTGDFHFDQTPPYGHFTDIHRLAELGREGVFLLLSDSANAEVAGHSPSEQSAATAIRHIMQSAKGRVIMVGYGASLYRLLQVINTATLLGRRTHLAWPNGVKLLKLAQETGHLTYAKSALFDPNKDTLAPEEQVIVVYGFGSLESGAACQDTKEGTIVVEPGDTVVLVAPPGPGSEKTVARHIDSLFKLGAEVYPELTSWPHPFGHACHQELKLMLNLIQPKYFVPIHGEYRQLVWHARIAQEVGVEPSNVLIVENGDNLELTHHKATLMGRVSAGKVLVDGLGVGDVGNIVLRDRKHLSQDGIIIVVITLGKEKGLVVAGPDIVSRGFVYVREAEELLDEAKEKVRLVIEKCQSTSISDWSTIKNQVRDVLGKFLFERTRRRPMILPIIMEI